MLGLDKIQIMPRAAMKKLALYHVGQFRQRVQSGRDYNGVVFVPYTDAYSKKKAKSGRNVSPPDFTYSGRTLRNLKPFGIIGKRYRLRFSGEYGAIVEGNANRSKNKRNIKDGIPDSELDLMSDKLLTLLNLEIKKKLKPKVKIVVG